MKYHSPGNMDELTPDLLTEWIKFQKEYIFKKSGTDIADAEANGKEEKVWIFNPIGDDLIGTVSSDIHWNAFPKNILNSTSSKTRQWSLADRSRLNQEEYCEWEVVRDPSTKRLKKVIFSTETRDYYRFLRFYDPDLLLGLYHEYVSPQVTLESISKPNGDYDFQNEWNLPERVMKSGAFLHMAHIPNSYGAAVNLSAQATWPSVNNNGELITDEQGLIDCRGFGDGGRHSDPHIGAVVNSLTRAGNEISFAGPIGLYFHDIDLSGFITPDESNINEWMKVTRGSESHMMRIEFQAPEESDFILGDVKLDNKNLVFGGQIAEKIEIRIQALVRNINKAPKSITCTGEPVKQKELISKLSVDSGYRNNYIEYID